jgi:hypothetical protein
VKSNDGRRGSRDATTNDSLSSLSLRQAPDSSAVDTPSLVDPFLVVQFVDFQISVHDHANKVRTALMSNTHAPFGVSYLCVMIPGLCLGGAQSRYTQGLDFCRQSQ